MPRLRIVSASFCNWSEYRSEVKLATADFTLLTRVTIWFATADRIRIIPPTKANIPIKGWNRLSPIRKIGAKGASNIAANTGDA